MKRNMFRTAVVMLAVLMILTGCKKSETDRSAAVPDKVDDRTEKTEDIDYGNEASVTEDEASDIEIPKDSAKDKDTASADNKKASSDEKKVSPEKCTHHRDSDDDGNCDLCGKGVTVTLDFYAMNDLHGKFDDNVTQPGVDELTMYFKERRMIEKNVILLSSGDMWQGSSESNLTEGKIMVDWMNEMGFESMTLGNHEFDWGEEIIEENSSFAEFPFLAINIYDVETEEPVTYCRPSVMIERDGIKIGIIGAMGDCYDSIAPDQTGGVYFITGAELTGLVREEALKLRAEGADMIVYSIHDGYSDSYDRVKVMTDGKLISYYDTVLSNGYVDLVFEGHTHQSYILMDSKAVYHLQNGGENQGISRAEVTVNTVNGSIHVITAEIVPSNVYAGRDSDALRDELLEKYSEEIAASREALGHNSSLKMKDELRELVARLYYERGVKEWGKDYDIVLGGGFISCRSPYFLNAGDVTYSMLQSLFPFDNELVLCSCSGLTLSTVFFNSRNSNYFVYFEDYGNEVKDSIDPAGIYYVVVDTYSSTYEPNHLTEIIRLGKPVYARDLLAEYFSGK